MVISTVLNSTEYILGKYCYICMCIQ